MDQSLEGQFHFNMQPAMTPQMPAGAFLNQMSQQSILGGGFQSQAQAQQYQQPVYQPQPPAIPTINTAAAAAYAATNGAVAASNTQIAAPQSSQQQGSVPAEGDLSALPNAITEWRRINEEISGYKQQIREKSRRAKALQDYILAIMKKHDIDALALKNSGGRIMFKRNKRAEGLGPKNLEKFLGEYLKSEEQAQAALKYIQDRRSIKTTEGLQYDKLD